MGTFTIVLPTDTKYEDIALQDKIKIYLGYGAPPATPTFVGYVQKIEGSASEDGYLRSISGLAQGEVLLRRLKCGHYYGTTAHDIADEFADDLVLGKDTNAEAQTPPLEFMNQTYFEAMQALSDCWISGAVQLRKDFYVDVNNNLVYKDRPLRTGTETFTVGSNITSYTVRRSLENVRNNITVFGNWDENLTVKIPTDENWTEPASATPPYWTGTVGTLSRDGVTKVVGSYSVKCDSAGGGINWNADFWRSLKPEYAFVSGNARTITQSFARLHYQCQVNQAVTFGAVYLFAPDTANYFWRAAGFGLGVWFTWDIPLPTTDALGGWTKVLNAQANFITGIRFYEHEVADFDCWIDDLALQGGRFCYKTTDATSIAAYGQRDLVAIDDALQSTGQCEARAKTLLFQRKDPTTQLEISTTGNTSVLVGDRLPFVLPRENVNGSFDVTVVEHTFKSKKFFTKMTALGLSPIAGADSRYTVSRTPLDEISRLKTTVRALSRDSRLTPR